MMQVDGQVQVKGPPYDFRRIHSMLLSDIFKLAWRTLTLIVAPHTSLVVSQFDKIWIGRPKGAAITTDTARHGRAPATARRCSAPPRASENA